MIATGRKANGTQLTHAKLAESTRCIAWKHPEAEERDREEDARLVAPAVPLHVPRADGDEGHHAAEEQEEPDEELARRRERGHRPLRRNDRPGSLEEAVEVIPGWWDGQLPTTPQVEHRLEHHALDHVPGAGHGEVHQISRGADRGAGQDPELKAPWRSPDGDEQSEADRDDEVQAVEQREARDDTTAECPAQCGGLVLRQPAPTGESPEQAEQSQRDATVPRDGDDAEGEPALLARAGPAAPQCCHLPSMSHPAGRWRSSRARSGWRSGVVAYVATGQPGASERGDADVDRDRGEAHDDDLRGEAEAN